MKTDACDTARCHFTDLWSPHVKNDLSVESWEGNIINEIVDIHRLGGPYDLDFCIASATQCMGSLISYIALVPDQLIM